MSTRTLTTPINPSINRSSTRWTDVASGRYLDRSELASRHALARRLYAVNAHIFEDEMDALVALGVAPTVEPLAAA